MLLCKYEWTSKSACEEIMWKLDGGEGVDLGRSLPKKRTDQN
jgi:hypothetical protein